MCPLWPTVAPGALAIRPRVALGPTAAGLGPFDNLVTLPDHSGYAGSLNLDWRLQSGTSPLSFDLSLESLSGRVANAGNGLVVPPSEVFDIGLRYRFAIAHSRALLRLQVANLFNDYSWRVSGNGALLYTHSRRVLAEVRVDF